MSEVENNLATPIQLDDLPDIVRSKMSQDQMKGLVFARRKFRVITPRIQTFHVGSVGKGNSSFGGLSKSLGESWNIFGGVASIELQTVNQFRTDIQLRLEDMQNKEKIFLEYSLPFNATFSVDQGDELLVLYASGNRNKLENIPQGFVSWSPFMAQDMDTLQYIPLSFLPMHFQFKIETEPGTGQSWKTWQNAVVVVVVIVVVVFLLIRLLS